MPRVSPIELLQKAEQPVLFVRTRTEVSKLPQLIGASYGKLAAYLGELGVSLAEVPYVAYHNMNMQDLDVEIGFPVYKPLPGKDDIRSGAIPAGRRVFCMYRGAYSQMEPTYNEMSKWMTEHGLKPVGSSYEHYFNGPDCPESELLTMVVMPIE